MAIESAVRPRCRITKTNNSLGKDLNHTEQQRVREWLISSAKVYRIKHQVF